MFTAEFQNKLFPMDNFRKQYQDVAKFLPFCQSCENYDNRWSCPPTSFQPEEYLAKFAQIIMIGTKVTYTHKAREVATTDELVASYSRRILKKAQKLISGQLLDLEQKFPGVKSCAAGSCPWCCKCTRPDNKPCKKPDHMRYSLDTFGLDLTSLCEHEFKWPLQWIKGALPEYQVLVSAILIPANVDSAAVLAEVAQLELEPFVMAPLTGNGMKHARPIGE